GGRAALCEDGQLVLAEGKARTPVVPVSEMPAALGGAARHNVANALAALAAATVLGVAPDAIARTLRRFGRAPDDNAGRANMVELGGVHLVIDYAHNPHGMAALTRMAAALPARRRLNVHQDRALVLALIERLRAMGWQAGEAVPET